MFKIKHYKLKKHPRTKKRLPAAMTRSRVHARVTGHTWYMSRQWQHVVHKVHERNVVHRQERKMELEGGNLSEM